MTNNIITFKVHNYDVLKSTRICKDLLDPYEKEDLLNNGYLRLKYKLDASYLNKLINATSEIQLNKYGSDSSNTYSSKKFAGQYIREPHKIDTTYLELISEKQPYIHILRSIMGPRIQIRSFSIRITKPFSEASTMWHRDQRSFISPQPIYYTVPHVFSLSFYLDGATLENGPLYVIPNSHKEIHRIEDEECYDCLENQKELILEKGEIVLFHSSLIHRGGENKSNENRIAIIIHFSPIFFKQAKYEDFEPNLHYKAFIESLRKNEDEAYLELLGEPGLRGYSLFM